MKKIFYFIASAIVALGAVACQNDINEGVTPEQEGFSINANIGDITRIAITDSDNKEDYKTLSWVGNETLTALLGENYVDFTNTTEKPNTFTCNTPGVKAMFEAQLKEKGAVNFYFGFEVYASGEYGNSDDEKCKFMLEGSYNGTNDVITMKLTQTIFHFSCEEEVTLKYTDEQGEGILYNYKNEYTFPVGEHYVGVFAATNATLEAWIGGEKVKSTTKSFNTGKIYNLGEIKKPAVSEFGVVGSFQTPTTWDVAKPVKMYETSAEGWVVAKGVELYKNDEFKIVKGNSWDVSYGLSTPGALALDTETAVVSSNSQNMKTAKNGKFDIYFNATAKKITYTCVEEFADLKVNITINNKANWSPLYITLKDGNNTIVDKALVSGNVYAISGNYIGQSLSYVLTTSNASKKSEGSVTISKTGAAIELEEVDVVTRIVYTNTQPNQIKYWGNKTCLYVWGSGSALDNVAYPGSVMTKDTKANTWYITIPSSLVGKTINYIINNGGGWKCADQKLTVKEGDNELTDSMLGIH